MNRVGVLRTARTVALVACAVLVAVSASAASVDRGPAASETVVPIDKATASPASATITLEGVDDPAGSQPGEADILEKYLTRSSSSVYFVHGSLILADQSLATIAKNAQRLIANPDERVTLVGYLEDPGSPSYSAALAERRAAIVKEALAGMGVRPQQIRLSVFNREPPETAPCQTEICRASYRRVEFLYGKPR
jgi:outer membrane protein OmpA-like peptidoglycan-associated protein